MNPYTINFQFLFYFANLFYLLFLSIQFCWMQYSLYEELAEDSTLSQCLQGCISRGWHVRSDGYMSPSLCCSPQRASKWNRYFFKPILSLICNMSQIMLLFSQSFKMEQVLLNLKKNLQEAVLGWVNHIKLKNMTIEAIFLTSLIVVSEAVFMLFVFNLTTVTEQDNRLQQKKKWYYTRATVSRNNQF